MTGADTVSVRAITMASSGQAARWAKAPCADNRFVRVAVVTDSVGFTNLAVIDR